MIKNYFKNGSRYGVQIEYLHEPNRLGTAGALSLLPEKPVETIIVMNGDIITKINFEQLLDFHRENMAKATMCVKEYQYQVPYGVVRVHNNHIYDISEKPTNSFFVNAGIYVLEPEILDYIPKETDYNMPSLFEKMVKNDIRAAAFPIREYWLDIGEKKNFDQANGQYNEVFQ